MTRANTRWRKIVDILRFLHFKAIKQISLFVFEEHFPVVLMKSLVGVLLIWTVKNVTIFPSNFKL